MTLQESDLDFLKDQLASLEGRFGTYHGNVARNRIMYNMQFDADIVTDDEDIEIVKPQTARLAIDESADHILTVPKVRIPVLPVEGDERTLEEERASKKQRFSRAAWSRLATTDDPIGAARKPMLREGRACIFKKIRWDLLPEWKPDMKGQELADFKKAMRAAFLKDLPWEMIVLDNTTVFEDPSNHRNPQYVYLKHRIFRQDAVRLYANRDEDGEVIHADWHDGDSYAELDYVEYYSKEDRVVWVDGNVVINTMNPYGYIPIFIDDAGFGDVYQGISIDEKFVGMTQFMEDIFIAEARSMSAWQSVLEQTAWPALMRRNAPDPSRSIQTGPGTIIDLDGDEGEAGAETLEYLQHPEIPLTLRLYLEKIDRLANDALKHKTLGGVPLSGVETATEADQQIRNASSKLSGPVGGLERLAKRLTESMFMDIDKDGPLNMRISIWGEEDAEATLGPEEINGFHAVRTELGTTDDEALNMVKARFWSELYRNVPGLSLTTVMRRGEMADDPIEEMRLRMLEDTEFSPEFARMRQIAAATLLQQLEEFAQAEAQRDERESDGAAGPQPSAPGGNPENGASLTQEALTGGLGGPAEAAEIRGPVAP